VYVCVCVCLSRHHILLYLTHIHTHTQTKDPFGYQEVKCVFGSKFMRRYQAKLAKFRVEFLKVGSVM
jgi:hypothetical protein